MQNRPRLTESSRVFNRQSVQSALRSVLVRLKTYTKVPPNGLVIFASCDECHVFEPPKPITKGCYLCDGRFHTELIEDQFREDPDYAYLILDGHGCMLFTVTGSRTAKVAQMKVSLPNKQGRGGQSKNRFERIRQEKRLWYIKAVAELVNKHLIDSETQLLRVEGLILAGSGSLKDELTDLSELDQRIKSKILTIVAIAKEGEGGLREALAKTAGVIHDTQLNHNDTVIDDFLIHALRGDPKIIYGQRQTILALEHGFVETLLLSQELEVKTSSDVKIIYINRQSEKGDLFFRGYGGIGGYLRYPIPEELLDTTN